MAIKQSWRKPLIAASAAIVLVAGFFFLKNTARKVGESQKIEQVSLASLSNQDNLKTVDVATPIPSTDPQGNGQPMQAQVMAWNSQFGLMFANGGVNTSKGSLFALAGINLHIDRQDACDKSCAAFVKNSKELNKDHTTQSPMIVPIMADGVSGYSKSLNEVRKWGSAAKVITFCGRSAGEDCFWGPEAWIKKPALALGHCVAGVERDGDMNIMLQWASSNGLPVNFDDTKYDDSAINIIGVGDFNMGDANTVGLVPTVLANKAVSRECIKHGKTVPGSHHDCTPDAFATWTPADQAIVSKRGGFVRIASTKEFASQMPNAVIIDSIWAATHDTTVVKLIVALGKAGDQIKSFDAARVFAAQVSAKVYGEKDANYWLKYFIGATDKDAAGHPVELGGSRAFNLADAADMFGLGKDGLDKYKITYETFAGILAKGYPAAMKGYTSYENMVDKHYLQMALDANQELKNGKTEDVNNSYASGSIVTNSVSTKKYPITFANNSAVLDPKMGGNASILKDMFNNAVLAKTQTVFIVGHTNRTGDEQHNKDLSKQRADAIEAYLRGRNREFFKDDNHIQATGVGSGDAPVQPDTDPANRCVIVTIGS